LINSHVSTERAFRIGLLIDSKLASKYIFDLAKWAAVHQNLRITHLIIHAHQGTAEYPKSRIVILASAIKSLQTGRTLAARFLKVTRISRVLKFLISVSTSVQKDGICSGFSNELSRVLYAAMVESDKRLFSRNDRHKDHLNSFDLSSLVPEVVHINPIVSRPGFVYRFGPMDVRRVRDLDLDPLVRCGSGVLRGDILRASKLGIISLHHADNRINRGGASRILGSLLPTRYNWLHNPTTLGAGRRR
jgi:hypothetical protein